MEIFPIKTRLVQPPKDDLYSVLDESLTDVREGDVVAVTSKVVAIHQGRCVKNDGSVDKDELARREADFYIPKTDKNLWHLAVKYHALLLMAGIDESNAGGYFVLLPEKPNKSAKEIRRYLQKRFNIKNVGVVITDSHSIPFRYGTMGVSIGFSGFEPVKYFNGEKDLFGREFKYTRISVADSLAVIANFMMGETTEQMPLCIVRDAPHVKFTNKDTTKDLFIPPEEDIYYQLLKPLYKKGKKK